MDGLRLKMVGDDPGLRTDASSARDVARDPGVQLRAYQQECLRTILERYRAGIRRQLVCLPTGTGKTVVFAQFPRFFRMKKRLLVLAHRQELLDQAREKILRANPDLAVDVEQADRCAMTTSHVVVASVPTLAHASSRRLEQLSPDEFFVIVVDEAHHAVAPSFRRVLEHFGVFDPASKKLVVGFTATPKRGDKQGLSGVFEEISYARNLPEMIDAGFLAPPIGYRIETDVDLSNVTVRHGDYVPSQLSRTINIRERNELLVRVHKDLLAERKTLCFCVDVAHAREVAAAFERSGVAAASVDGGMARAERARVLAAFRQGALRILTNCMVLTEGYDDPSIDALLLARPTKSTLLYTQMIGRGTRLCTGKQNVAVVDVADTTCDHRLITLPTLFGLPGGFDLAGRAPSDALRAFEWTQRNRPWVRFDAVTSLDELRYRCRVVDLLALETPEQVRDLTEFAWIATGSHAYRLPLKYGDAITLTSTILDEWEIAEQRAGVVTVIGRARTLANALRRADEFASGRFVDQLPLLARDVRWRHEPASERQCEILQARGIEVPSDITKGQASRIIALLLSGSSPRSAS